MLRHPLWLPLGCCLILLGAPLVPAQAQFGDAYLNERQAAAANLVRAAFQSYRQGVEQQDEALFWDAVDTLTHVFEDYGETSLARDNFLTVIEILCKKIGTPEAYDGALRMLEGYQYRYGDPLTSVGMVDPALARDMHLAQVEHFYTYRHDYNEAARRLNAYYAAYAPQLTSSERVRAKLMEARVQRKQGDFASARRAYGIAEEASKMVSAEAARQGRGARPLSFQREMQFCEAVATAKRLEVGPHLVHGLEGVTTPQLQGVAARLEEALMDLGLAIGTDPDFPLDIFVFSGMRDLAGLTGQEAAYVLAEDGELYVLPETPLKALLAQVAALAWRVRPVNEVPQVLAEGLPSALGMPDAEIRRGAAGARELMGKDWKSEVLLDPRQYADLPDRSAVAAAFVQHLLQSAGKPRFGKLYAGWEVIPATFGEVTTFSQLEVDGGPSSRINIDGMKRAFRSVVGQDYDTVFREFSNKLELTAKQEREAFEKRTGGLRSVSIVNDSPQAAVLSWVAALQAGDTQAMLQLAAKPLKAELESTFADLKGAGVMDAVRLWTFAMPYSDLTPEVETVRNLGGVQRQVTVALKRQGQVVRRHDITVWEEQGGKWYLATSM